MAKTTQEYYDEIMTEASTMSSLQDLDPQPDNSQQFLNDLTTDSSVAEHRIWAWLTAYFMHLFHVLIDTAKAYILEVANRAKPQTERWYAQKLDEFQYGDALVYPNNVPVYDPVDTSKRIVKRRAVNSVGGILTFKVAGEDGNGLRAMNTGELNAIEAYIHKIIAPGTNWQLISLNKDTVKVSANIYFEGQYLQSDVQQRVEDAINAYLASIEFDGSLEFQKLVDAIQAVEGVEDVEILSMDAKNGGGPYQNFTRVWSTVSGWVLEDDTPGNRFQDTLNYISNV